MKNKGSTSVAIKVIEHTNNAGFEIEIIQSAPTSYSDVRQRQQILERIIRIIYINMPVYIVTKEPQEWSFCYEIGVQHDFLLDQERYIASPVILCSPQFLTSILDDDEFERDLLWIVSADPEPSAEDVFDLITLYSRNYQKNLQTDREIVRAMANGRILQWYTSKDNANKKVNEITKVVNALST